MSTRPPVRVRSRRKPLQPPKPVDVARRVRDYSTPVPQTMHRLSSAGVQRSTVELNAMSPMQILEHRGTWSILQHRVGLVPASAVAIDELGEGYVEINVGLLPRVSRATEPGLDRIDADCQTSVPINDGAAILSGKLIVQQPAGVTSKTRVMIRYSGSYLTETRISWSGIYGIGSIASTDIRDHQILGATYPHANTGMDKTNGHGVSGDFGAVDVAADRAAGVFEVAIWRTDSSAADQVSALRLM